MSYASQEPWIFSGTLKDNILFGQPFDQAWFDRVVECCSLVRVSHHLLATCNNVNYIILNRPKITVFLLLRSKLNI